MKNLKALLCALLILGLSSIVSAQDLPAEPPATEEAVDAPEEADKPTDAPEEAPAEEEKPAAEEDKEVEGTEEAGEAPAEKKSEVGSALGKLAAQAVDLLTIVLMLLGAWLTKKGITFVEKKTKVDIPAKYEEMLKGWAGSSINYASEKAHQFLAEKGEKMKGGDKLEAALGFGLSLAEEHGVSDLGKEKLVKYIESKLGEGRSA